MDHRLPFLCLLLLKNQLHQSKVADFFYVQTSREDVKALNNYLETYQARVFEAKRKPVDGKQMVTASAIKDMLMGIDQRNKMLIKIFKDYNADVKKIIAIDYSKSTWTKYDRTKRFTQIFIAWKFKTEDIRRYVKPENIIIYDQIYASCLLNSFLPGRYNLYSFAKIVLLVSGSVN